MDYMTHKDNGHESDPQAGHKMSGIQATHDRHAGHSVAMFREESSSSKSSRSSG
jgi:Cu2+-exporting ATPase